jgi:hypothetical protein
VKSYLNTQEPEHVFSINSCCAGEHQPVGPRFHPSGEKARGETSMNASWKKVGVAALAALTIGGATIATSSTAEARWRGGGWHRGGGWVGPAIVGGLALGALAATRPAYGYGYGYPAYGYYGGGYDGCYLQRRVVGYTQWGRPIVRPVRVCY